MISSIDSSRVDENVIDGVITTFVRLDTDGNWFDASTMSEATEDQISTINIPGNLYPNAASFYIHLDGDSHRLYIQTYSKGKSLTVASAQKIISALSRDLDIIEKFGEAKISFIQTKFGLERVLSLPVIKELKITILKPNADIFSDDFEDEIEAHLAQAHSKKLVLTYEADASGSVVATDSIRTTSAAALDNGQVEARGRDETGAVTISTQSFPKILQSTFDPEHTSEQAAFQQLVTE